MAQAAHDDDTTADAKAPPLISHDLRSALSDVIGGLELIDTGELSDSNRIHFDRALASSKSLTRLMTTLTDSLRGYSRDLGADRNFFTLTTFIDDLSRRWNARAVEKGLRFVVDLGPTLPVFLQLDRTMFDRILSNLLENAIKFCAEGQVNLALGIEDDHLTVVVRDTGTGFSKEALDQLFDLRGRPTVSGMPGTGLGLHIVKKLVDQLNGDIKVFNVNSGGMVVLKFPRSSWQSNVETAAVSDAMIVLKDKHVLLAEDNQTSQLVLKRIVERLGARLVVANDGVVALREFNEQEFDLVLLDVEMPRLSGLEVIKSIRNLGNEKAKTPIIAVTAFVMPEHELQILAAGANGTIPKPVTDTPAFARMVSKILAQSNPSPSNGCSEDGVPSAKNIVDEAVFNALAEAVGPEQMPELLDKVLDDLLSVQYRLSDAVQSSNFKELRAQTHVLISVAGAVGAKNLQLNSQLLNVDANKQNTSGLMDSAMKCVAELRELIAEIKRRKKTGASVAR